MIGPYMELNIQITWHSEIHVNIECVIHLMNYYYYYYYNN